MECPGIYYPGALAANPQPALSSSAPPTDVDEPERRSRWDRIRQNSRERVLASQQRGSPTPRLRVRALTIIHRPSIASSDNMAGNNSLPALEIPMSGGNRNTPSPTSSVVGSQANGANAAAYGSPLNAGHQQDLNYLYTQIQELSALLKANREKTAILTKAAEELGRRAQSNGLRPEEDTNGSVQSDQALILSLKRELANKDSLIATYAHEQRENTSLIALYEDAVGTMTEQIRNYCLGIESKFLSQKRHYNDLLQAEKDEHLQSRLDRDEWHAKTLRCAEMIRTANRLRTDEWCEEYAVVAGLQGEVRCYRRVLGMDPQAPEEEGGWPYLNDLPLNDTGPI